jgi:hypothetical protein
VTAPKIPAAIAGECDVKDGPRKGWTMVFGTADAGVQGKAWSTSGPCLEAIAGVYADLRAAQAEAAEAAAP